MEVTNEENTETPLLTNGDLAIAAYAISQCFNAYLESYEREDYEEMTKEQMESSMNALQASFAKFDALVKTLQQTGQDASETDKEDGGDDSESKD
jgi:phosphoglucomutase